MQVPSLCISFAADQRFGMAREVVGQGPNGARRLSELKDRFAQIRILRLTVVSQQIASVTRNAGELPSGLVQPLEEWFHLWSGVVQNLVETPERRVEPRQTFGKLRGAVSQAPCDHAQVIANALEGNAVQIREKLARLGCELGETPGGRRARKLRARCRHLQVRRR